MSELSLTLNTVRSCYWCYIFWFCDFSVLPKETILENGFLVLNFNLLNKILEFINSLISKCYFAYIFLLQTVAPSHRCFVLEARMRSDVSEIHSQNVSHRGGHAGLFCASNQYNQTNCNSMVLLLVVVALLLFVRIKWLKYKG